ncbi:MAG: hypothetical protein CTY38_04790 [Methylotenera sp.]|uniref:type II toxin-antitoxin system MqsA family antitoxin n=1 Tax=Methylotenera sp. TaxID=2051956 RepID=UPI000D460C0B|nr:MAG: hypothetical protein CTY38_04790 [Methylotenera sp.]
MICPVCGAGELVHDVRDLPYSYKGKTTVIHQVNGDYCSACNESITNMDETARVMDQMLAFNRLVAKQSENG